MNNIWKQMFQTWEDYFILIAQPLLIIIGTIGIALFHFEGNLKKPQLYYLAFGIAGLMVVVNVVTKLLVYRIKQKQAERVWLEAKGHDIGCPEE